MVYRPLVERTEWNGCAARNPDHSAYAALFASIRDQFHVVSIADLVPNVEWISGARVEADQKFHAGELEFEALAGLFSIASLVFCSPGFAVILAQTVGTTGGRDLRVLRKQLLILSRRPVFAVPRH